MRHIGPVESRTVELYATEAKDAYAVRLEGDSSATWRAENGIGQDFHKVWSVELQSRQPPQLEEVDWEAVLVRVIGAYDLSNPLLTNFDWPRKQLA